MIFLQVHQPRLRRESSQYTASVYRESTYCATEGYLYIAIVGLAKIFSFVRTCRSCMYHVIHLFCFVQHVHIMQVMHVSCHTFVLFCVACPYKFPHILQHRFSSNSQYQEKPVHRLCRSSLEMKFGLWLVWLNSVFVQLLRKLKAFLRQLGIAVQESWLKFVYYLWYSNLCKFSS